MNNIIYAFLITIFSGFSTLLGLIPLFFNLNSKIFLKISMFVAAVTMIYVSLTNLLPSAINTLNSYYSYPKIIIFISLSFLLGNVIASLLDKKINISDNKIYKAGIVTGIGLIIHNLLEGIATFVTSSHNILIGLKLAIAITLHNIPEGLSIAMPIYYGSKNKGKALLVTSLAGIAEIIGAFLSYFLLKNILNDITISLLYSLIAGLMLYIALYELLPNITDF